MIAAHSVGVNCTDNARGQASDALSADCDRRDVILSNTAPGFKLVLRLDTIRQLYIARREQSTM